MGFRITSTPLRAKTLYRVCKSIGSDNRNYVFGGGHGPLLSSIGHHDGLDCSSSCSLALRRSGLFHSDRAIVSGAFASWGVPGRGRYFTVWFSGVHVWIQFHGIARFWRFDTSPHGSGGLGPHMRLGPRSTATFNPRHWPGL